ncbi:MAG TPA: LacI family DNA-binding transcriptional regulator [Chthoniobacterales bacterium]
MIPPVSTATIGPKFLGKATISHVARDAGVSKTSVSRYLGGEGNLLSEEKFRRIQESISRLGFRPNQMARGLKRGRTRLIGMMVTDILNPYPITILNGVEEACRQHGFSLMLCNAAGDDALEHRYLSALESYSVEGLILQTLGRNVSDLEQLTTSGLPIVLVDRKITGFDTDTVGLDSVSATFTAVSHLIEQGFRDVFFVSEPIKDLSSRRERLWTFRQAMGAEEGCRESVLEVSAADGAKIESEIAAFLANKGPGPKAIFAGNGVILLAVTKALKNLGCRLFEDVGLIGIDEMDWCSLVGSGITTVAQPGSAIGKGAVECLIRRLEGDKSVPAHTAFTGKLIPRGSTSAR